MEKVICSECKQEVSTEPKQIVLDPKVVDNLKSFLEDNKINHYSHKVDNLEIDVKQKVNTQGFEYVLFEYVFPVFFLVWVASKIDFSNLESLAEVYPYLSILSVLGLCLATYFVSVLSESILRFIRNSIILLITEKNKRKLLGILITFL